MADIIDFERLQKQRYVEQHCSLQKKEHIDRLVEEQTITIKEHASLIRMLRIFEDKQIEPKIAFRDVFEMNRKDFERVYKLDWWLVVEHCFIFLKVLKDNNPEDYNIFFII